MLPVGDDPSEPAGVPEPVPAAGEVTDPRIDPTGQPFDPSIHEAVSVVPPGPGQADHTVSATFQAGYRFKGGLIRPARVQVFSSEGHA